ncbi:hypothetical protein BOX37_05185 [Nocardia mangyaensis]|uniref:Uncharacterized protein n=1 Tax=Nocardia mangyaensis TaxID=2213200 RepID=A0A1J0VN64_9NOCA|nr:hypothetical protein BOX37_05185 [Nocardia mangyaensis]
MVLGAQLGRESRTTNRVSSGADSVDLGDRALRHSNVVVRELLGNKGTSSWDSPYETPRLQQADHFANDDA